MLNLGILFGLLLTSALATLAFYVVRPQHTRPVALVATALLSFVWLIARASLPLSLTIGTEEAVWSAWSWQVGQLGWLLSLAVLLLTLGALALDTRQSSTPSSGASDAALIQLLAIVTLLACWAGSLTTYVMTWTLLAVVWAVGIALSENERQQRLTIVTRRLGAALGSVLLLWLAASSAGPNDDISSMGGWPAFTRVLVLSAATYQLGVFPFHRWRMRDRSNSSPRAAMLLGGPAAAGAVLLARLEASAGIGLAFALPFTLLGLLALLSGARRAWISSDLRSSLPIALIQAQAGMVLLAGVWTGPQSVVAESLLLLLGGGVLLLSSDPRHGRLTGRIPQPGLLISVAAFAALPLTVGFTGRSALYSAWLEQGRWILVLATALLQLPVLVALLFVFLHAGQGANMKKIRDLSTLDLPRLLALLLPALGLFSWTSLRQTSSLSWLAILAPAALAGILVWRIQEASELSQTLREAFAIPGLPAGSRWSGARGAATAAATAARDAVALLEGEGGTLWLLLFVVILTFV